MTIAKQPRLDWVDYAKGICIFAVVSMYSNMLTGVEFGDSGWLQHWADFAKPFRMPDFFLLSGLFLSRVINKSWRGYLDKKVVHYSYFFLLWTFINLLILHAVSQWDLGVTPVGVWEGGVKNFMRQLWQLSSSWPWMMLWFIQMLPAYFLFTKLTLRIPVWIILFVAVVLQAFPQIVEAVVHAVPPLQGSRALVDEFWTYFVYFYVGYIAAPYFFKFADFIKTRVLLAVIGLLVWATINASLVQYELAELPFVGLFLGLAGATAVITLASLASNYEFARWIRYLGKNSIVVYLGFYWPTKFALALAAGVSVLTLDYGTFGAIVTIMGIFASVAFFWLVRESRYTRWLFERPAWISVGSYDTPPAATRPTASGEVSGKV